MTHLSKDAASRIIATLEPVHRTVSRYWRTAAVPSTLDTRGYMPHCGCPRCTGIRLVVYGSSDKLPPGTPLGSYPSSSSQGAADIGYIESKYTTDSTSWAVGFERRWSDASYGIFGPYGV